MRFSQRWLIAVVTGCAVAAFGSFSALVIQEGGLVSFLFHIDEFRVNHLRGVGPYMLGMSTMNAGFLVTYMASQLGLVSGWWAVLTLLASVSVGLAGAYRHLAVEAFAAWLVLRDRFQSFRPARVRGRRIIAVYALVFVTLNILYVAFRDGRGDVVGGIGERDLGELVFQNFFARFHGTESLARVVEYTDANGYTGGPEVFKSFALAWVPRAIWEDKPTSIGAIENVMLYPEIYRNYEESGAAIPSLAGELYWTGGPMCLIAGFGLFGWICAYADRVLARRSDFTSVGLYVYCFSFFLYVNETLTLHVFRFIQGAGVWLTIAYICRRTVWLGGVRGAFLRVRQQELSVAQMSVTVYNEGSEATSRAPTD
jgi:hypothetical protein